MVINTHPINMKEVKVDDKGARDMFNELSKRTGMTYRDVVRGISAEILTLSARRTKAGTVEGVMASVEKLLHRPYRTRDGARIGRTKEGRVWYSGPSWPRDRWVLVDDASRARSMVKKAGGRVPGRTARRDVKITDTLRNDINRAVAELNEYQKRQRFERKARLGSSQASYLHIMEQLGLQPTSTSGLSRAMKAELTAQHKSSLSGTEKRESDAEFNVVIDSKSQSALNPRAGGIPAFNRSLNGKIKEFQNASKKDLKAYAERFASRHGFRVQ